MTLHSLNRVRYLMYRDSTPAPPPLSSKLVLRVEVRIQQDKIGFNFFLQKEETPAGVSSQWQMDCIKVISQIRRGDLRQGTVLVQTNSIQPSQSTWSSHQT